MKKLHTIGVAVALCFATTANAALTFIDSAGNPVSGPALIDNSKEAIYFTETTDGYNGQYTVTNNTLNYTLDAFGISNPGTTPWVGFPGSSFGCGSDVDNSWCYASSILDTSSWNTTALGFDPVTFADITGFSLFGDISNVLDTGDTMINFYEAADGALGTGDTWNQFFFGPALLASQMFVVLNGTGGAVYASGGQPVNAVPLPAAVWLFGSGLLGLAGLAKRKKTTA